MSEQSILTIEQQRLAALRSYHIMDTVSETDFDELTELAAAICGTPIALISFVEKDRQWFKSVRGLDIRETNRAESFCTHAINYPDELFQVEDTRKDSRFSDNPFVTGTPNIVFYAGQPLVDSEGLAIGSLCVIDDQARKLTQQQQSALRTLARQIMNQLELRRTVRRLEISESAIRLAMEAGSLGSTEVDFATRKMKPSTQFLKHYGRREGEEFTYDQLFEAIAPEHRSEITRRVAKAVQSNTIYNAEYPITWPDGTKHWISAYGKPRYDHKGNPTHIIGLVADITDLKNNEERKIAFMSMVSHELKTPLTSIGGYLQVLQAEAKKEGKPFIINAIDRTLIQVKKWTPLSADSLTPLVMKTGVFT
jgi:PAS domain S-box-containing protein